MSRVITPIKVGDRVFWEDADTNHTSTVILSGTVNHLIMDKARISAMVVHSVVSNGGLSSASISSLSKIIGGPVDVPIKDLKRMEDAKWVIS